MLLNIIRVMSIKSFLAISLCLNVGLAAAYVFKSPPALVETVTKTVVKAGATGQA